MRSYLRCGQHAKKRKRSGPKWKSILICYKLRDREMTVTRLGLIHINARWLPTVVSLNRHQTLPKTKAAVLSFISGTCICCVGRPAYDEAKPWMCDRTNNTEGLVYSRTVFTSCSISAYRQCIKKPFRMVNYYSNTSGRPSVTEQSD